MLGCCGAEWHLQQRGQTARTDFAPAARFELVASVDRSQPDSQQNKTPRPKQPGATRNKTAMLIALLTALRWWRERNLPVKHKCIREAMHGGKFAYCSYPSRLSTSCRQSLLNERWSRSVGDPRAGRGFQPAGLATAGCGEAATISIWSARRQHQWDAHEGTSWPRGTRMKSAIFQKVSPNQPTRRKWMLPTAKKEKKKLLTINY